ncbi:Light-sensor Protein kinase [Xylographa bjoerkii]|nr:Light-sensor Protein kinase [Xylographa bjoerkii]MCJ1395971.1 Light-sensor Protein kinase [Xylographa bjoerkii]
MWTGPAESNMNSADSSAHESPPPSPARSRPISEHPPPSRSPRPRLWSSQMNNNPITSFTGNDNEPQSLSSLDASRGALSPGATDRVFPMRSVVSVDPTPTPLFTPAPQSESRGDGFPGMVLPIDPMPARRLPGHRRQSVSTDQASEASANDTPSRPQRRVNEGTKSREYSIHQGKATLSDTRKTSESAKSERDQAAASKQIHILSDNTSDGGSESEVAGSTYSGVALKSGGAASIRSTADSTASGLVTARFQHIVTDGGHAIITGRDGETLQRCEDEPIHIPGAVQGFGLLIALSEDSEGKLPVRVVSENSLRIIGHTPRQLFALDSFLDILSEEQADNLIDHLDFIRDQDTDPATNGPEVFTLAVRSSSTRKALKLWCAMHINMKNPDLIICEFELEDDQEFPLVPLGTTTPEPPEDTLQANPTAEEIAESTTNSSRPLRVLRSARKRKGEAAAMEVFNIMSQVQEQLANAPNLEKFLKVLVGVVKELTGFHRVMVYQFDQSWNGRVVTELVDPRATKDLYKGLNFPASDIPKQARDLYKINKVRLLYDRDQITARLVCRTVEDLETPLDLTYAYLRAMSPVHIKYLGNMGVRASMSISINAFNELWGLIACHCYGAKGMRVSFPIRKMCRLVGDSASRNIERLSYASRLQARKLINTAPSDSNPSGYIIASSDDLLKLFDADCGMLSIRDETKILGKLEETQEALAMLEYLRVRKITSVMSSQDIVTDFPDLRYTPGFTVLTGLLFVPLSVEGSDFIAFFRKGQQREVKWAGNPYEKYVRGGTEGYLEPRKSFKTWSETIVGKCREWTEEQIETAAVLCLVYGKFIEVWRQKEVALQNSQLTRLLLANSAHEVRTPLNAIINYLEIAMEGSLDSETRENLSKSHSASKSLIYVINDLLDLTKTEEGNNLNKDDVFDLPATVREAADMFTGDAKRKQISYEVTENPGVPQFVIGDQRKIRQAICNVTANAIQHTKSGSVKVELWLAERVEGHAEIDIVIQDTGTGMSAKKLDALFRDFEQVQSESDELLQEKLAPDAKALTSEKSARRTLGLGLAIVARIVRNMNGQLRLKSEEGKGSRFVIQLGFDLPVQKDRQSVLEESKEAGLAPPPDHPQTPPVEDGEVMLVNKSAQRSLERGSRNTLSRRDSGESMNSGRSVKSFQSGSSGMSDVDRLIGAIQEPYMVSNNLSNGDTRVTRSASKARSRPSSLLSSRPSMSRSHTMTSIAAAYGSVSMHSPSEPVSGQASVLGSKTPIRPVRMPDEAEQSSAPVEKPLRGAARVLFDIPDKPIEELRPPDADHLSVLVAEDDPINSKIIKKRLEKLGHEVSLTVNGEECASAYGDHQAFFDVVLMDMQMPIVDGLTSTKMIRSYEKSHPTDGLSRRATLNRRVPIFAVSASLVEKERQTYIDGGFDGWILKPIDFKRLSILLLGIVESSTRESCLYKPGEWEKGGWFSKTQPDAFASSTTPSPLASVSATKVKSVPDRGDDPFDDPISQEQKRLNNLTTDAVNDKSIPETPGTSGTLDQADP